MLCGGGGRRPIRSAQDLKNARVISFEHRMKFHIIFFEVSVSKCSSEFRGR